jgi:protein-L-isoaspartate(D-aspartate) O-methyltransferase
MNLEQARFNMIEQQIRTWEVLDQTVLDLLQQVPREAFVPPQYAGLAFADLEIPLGHGEFMLSPKMEARIVQSLALKASDTVLEIGTGSGYLTALLAKLTKQVYSVERIPEFVEAASNRLHKQGITNVILETGDGAQGWDAGSYDVIVLGGSEPVLAPALQQSLNVGGRLFAVVGEAPTMAATLITRISAEVFRTSILFETCIPALLNAPQPQRFSF